MNAHIRSGFTLVEMLVVIAILAILAAALMPAIKNARADADAARCQANLRNLYQATLSYQAVEQHYPFADSYEMLNDTDGQYYLKLGWVNAGIPPSKLDDTARSFMKGQGVEESQADKLYYSVHWCYEDADKSDQDTKWAQERFAGDSIREGCLWEYTKRDASAYVCPTFARAQNTHYTAVRSYCMNFWLGSRRQPRWWHVRVLDAANGARNASTTLLFSEMRLWAPYYSADSDRNRANSSAATKRDYAFASDGACDYPDDVQGGPGLTELSSADDGSDLGAWKSSNRKHFESQNNDGSDFPWGIHRRAGKSISHAIFMDGHIEFLEGGARMSGVGDEDEQIDRFYDAGRGTF